LSEFMRKVVDFATSKLGCGYIYGATGWVCTPARRAQQAAQYPDQYNNIMVVGAKWDGKQCFDCAQLTRWAVDAAGGKLPSGANSQFTGDYWSAKGAIGGIPLDRPCFVFRLSDGRAQHVGIYIGNGEVVEARGTKDGVIRSKLGAYAWTHYAEHREAGTNTDTGGGEQMGEQMQVYASSGKTVRMRSMPSTSAVVLKEIPIGSAVQSKGQQGEWTQITYEGTSGWMQSQFLRAPSSPAIPNPGDTGDMVQVPRALLENIMQSNTAIADSVRALLGVG